MLNRVGSISALRLQIYQTQKKMPLLVRRRCQPENMVLGYKMAGISPEGGKKSDFMVVHNGDSFLSLA